MAEDELEFEITDPDLAAFAASQAAWDEYEQIQAETKRIVEQRMQDSLAGLILHYSIRPISDDLSPIFNRSYPFRT